MSYRGLQLRVWDTACVPRSQANRVVCRYTQLQTALKRETFVQLIYSDWLVEKGFLLLGDYIQIIQPGIGVSDYVTEQFLVSFDHTANSRRVEDVFIVLKRPVIPLRASNKFMTRSNFALSEAPPIETWLKP